MTVAGSRPRRTANASRPVMDNSKLCLVLASALVLVSCAPAPVEEAPQPEATGVSEYVRPDTDLALVTGQTIFVPAYSEIRRGPESRLSLSLSLAIHNTSLSEPLVVQSVRHYETNGNLIKEYVEQSLRLDPLATMVFEVEGQGQGAGAGGNFIVEWAAEKAIYEPVVEAVMVGSIGTHGFSLISPGRVMKRAE